MGAHRAWGLPLVGLLALSHLRTSLGLRLLADPTLLEALPRLARERREGLCITIDGPFMGRLSNTVAMVNDVLKLALATSNNFRFPRYYTDYMEQEGFTDLFGTEPTCPARSVQVFSPTCNPSESRNHNPRLAGRCEMRELRVDMIGRLENSTYCGCEGLVVVDSNTLVWTHNYHDTHSVLSQRYWQSFRMPLASRRSHRPQVAVHMRLGDVENNCEKRFSAYNCQKRLQADIYCQTLRALLTVLSPSCADVNLVTDGTSTSPDVQLVTQCLRTLGIEEPRVFTASSMSARKSFDFLAHADVLVFGASGFGEVAAVLAQGGTARVGAPMPPGHPPAPLGFLPNTTQLQLPAANLAAAAVFENESVVSLLKNPAIKALKRTCSASTRQAARTLPEFFLQEATTAISIERDTFES